MFIAVDCKWIKKYANKFKNVIRYKANKYLKVKVHPVIGK